MTDLFPSWPLFSAFLIAIIVFGLGVAFRRRPAEPSQGFQTVGRGDRLSNAALASPTPNNCRMGEPPI